MVSYVHQALLNGIETEVRTLQDDEQILLRDGTVGGMNELPPAADRFLDFLLRLFTRDESVNQPVHLAVDGQIRDRDFLGHVGVGLSLTFGATFSAE
jgi:hypothetical protein